MEIGAKMAKSINNQIQAELDSAYLYLSMATWFEEKNLPGCAHWMKKQAEEEQEHAMKFYDYLVERGARVLLQAIPEPKTEWNNVTEVFEEVLAHEQKVTDLIYKLMDQAVKEKDYASISCLTWFVDEQVEEEDTASGILEQVKCMGEGPMALRMLDKQLADR
jgi:ferritin